MKNVKLSLSITIFSILIKLSTAQINVNSSGYISLTNVVAPLSGAGIGVQSYSNMVFSTANSNVTAAPFIKAVTGYSTGSSPDYTWYNDYGTGLFHPTYGVLGFAANYGEGMRINSNQSVLIGQTSGYDRLDITGSNNQNPLVITTAQSSNSEYSATNYLNNSTTKCWAVEWGGTDRFYVTGAGTVWCYGTYTTSDSTLKENVQFIKNPLKKVLQLNGVTFNYKSYGSVQAAQPEKMPMQMGFLAQAVERVVPEAVATNDKGIKGVNYACMVSLLVEAIKEQNSRIDSLQAIIVNCCENNSLSSSNSNSLSNVVGAALYQNNPNPFTRETSISYFLPSTTQSASLMILDMEGKMLKSIPISSYGQGAITINGGDFSAGMYYYTLIADGREIGTKKMILTQ